MQHFIRAFLFRLWAIFIGCFIITLPFSYQFFPNIGIWLSPFLGKITTAFGQSLGLALPYMHQLASDSSGFYLLSLFLLLFSALISAIWTSFNPLKHFQKAHYWLRSLCSYYLAFQFFNYGFDKVFKTQFYLPEPNTLFTPLGQLSKDILYWSSIGSSYSYTVFSGFMEIIPAFLLLFKPTRMIGAMISVLVVLNILMINIGFDISVKLFSFFLFGLSLYIAFPAFQAIYQLFFRQQKVSFQLWQPVWEEKQRLMYAIGKSLVIFMILYEALIAHFSSGIFNDDLATRPPLHGAYQVTEIQILSDSTATEQMKISWKRFFIHRKSYFIIQSELDSLQDYKLKYQEGQVLGLTDYQRLTTHFTYQVQDRLLILQGNFEDKEIRVVGKVIPWRELPLLREEIHWMIDGY